MTAGEARQVKVGQVMVWGDVSSSTMKGKAIDVTDIGIKVKWDDGLVINYRYDARWFHMLQPLQPVKEAK